MKDEPKKIWVDALLSNQYGQARDTFIDGKGNHCCLAVLTHEAAKRDVPGVRWKGRDGGDFDVLYVLEPGEDWAAVKTVAQAEKALQEYEEFDSNNGSIYPREAESETVLHKRSYYDWLSWDRMGDASLPPVIVDWAGLDNTNPMIGDDRAIHWNDTEQYTFEEIAEIVGEHL